MAFRAFAVLVSVDGDSARYDCGVEEDGPERGIVRVSWESEPVYSWEDGRPNDKISSSIAGKAVRLFRESGHWPANASIQAG
jgi:hypothetical protein